MSNMTLERPAPPAGTRTSTTSRWIVDPEGSTVEFRVPTFWGLSTVAGQFHGFEGFYGIDAHDGPAIELVIDAGSLETGNGTRDRHLRGEHFFDVAEHSEVRFSSTSIDELDGTMAIHGHLEAAGRELPVSLEATVREAGEDLEIEATITVDQHDLGMTYSPLGMIRTPATLHVRARLTPDRGRP